ncbi:MAG: cohesin domain-containing protein [Planctomycetales bacterium]
MRIALNSKAARRAAAAVLVASCWLVRPQAAPAAPVTFAVASRSAGPREDVAVAIEVRGAQGVGGVQFLLRYDSGVLDLREAEIAASGAGGIVDLKPGSPGSARIALITDKPITQDGPIVNLLFHVQGEPGGSTALTLHGARAWNHASIEELQVAVEPGQVTITAPAPRVPLWMLLTAGGILLVLLVLVAVRRKRPVGA